MLKYDYFLKCIEQKFYVRRSWLMRVFGIKSEDHIDKTPWGANFVDGKWFTYDDNLKEVPIEGVKKGEPLFPYAEVVDAKPGDIANLTSKVKTTYSQILNNELLYVWPWGGKTIPFDNGLMTPKDCDRAVFTALKAKELDIENYYTNYSYVFARLSFWSQIAVVCATEKTLKPSKKALKVKDEMIKHYKKLGRLNDPVALADISQKISAADKEDMKGDPAERFLYKGKQYDIVRMKTYHFQGGITDPDDPSKMIMMPESLQEGTDPKYMYASVNALRTGTFGRALDTALGGLKAKEAARIFQNTKIMEHDCGTKVGEPYIVTKEDVKSLIGFYLVGDNTPLTADRIRLLIGKLVYVRSPWTCKESGRNLCKYCMGSVVADSKVAIGPQTSQASNKFTSVALAAFHGSAMKLHKLTLANAFDKIPRN